MTPSLVNAEFIDNILRICMTRGTLMSLAVALDDIKSILYTKNSSFEQLFSRLPYTITNTCIDIVSQLQIKKGDTSSASVIEELKKALISTPTISITLAVEPTNVFLVDIYSALNFLGQYTLDVTVDTSILGGIIIESSGRHIDKSLNSYVDTFFVSNKAYVEELLR